ncbi:C-type lectin-1 [Trichostrongylus colubriformis]|uniref:C-type lectin-1 n=1 Tax=Trichostrongylus colubriformis TaxID=6319 RepID=A0AAN8IGD9_TRICO
MSRISDLLVTPELLLLSLIILRKNCHSGVQITCPSGWTYFDKTDSCYKNFLWAKSFHHAEEMCREFGGHLASIHSAEENTFMTNLVMTGYVVTKSNYHTWIGLIKEGRNWKWTDGSSVDYTNWFPGQPDGVGGGVQCAQLWGDYMDALPRPFPMHHGSHWRTGKWNDIRCTTQMRSYVCKKAPCEYE